MNGREHHYSSSLTWDGNRGEGTATYAGYGREFRVEIDGKPPLHGSADPAFRGDAAKVNPEDMLLAALSSCHMLSYLALCARERIAVLEYRDDARGVMTEDGRGGGRFTSVTLRPVVTIADVSHRERAMELHHRAAELCFIASSCNFPIHHEPEVNA